MGTPVRVQVPLAAPVLIAKGCLIGTMRLTKILLKTVAYSFKEDLLFFGEMLPVKTVDIPLEARYNNGKTRYHRFQ
ncbi:hypothetical protein [Neomoorella thermoacetica]|uniref:hypothetical protein n=1 Tax=Neomoorella thermoacetica TaxID=1525 RepID=UPI0008FAEDAC|nr:hypothetical protein [Moorella thermoacetica]